MSKIGNWYLDMQESAAELTKEQFISKWGEIHLDIWEEVSFALNGEGIQNLETIYNEVLIQKRQDDNKLRKQEIITKNSLIKIKQIINEKLEENKILQEEFTLMNYSKGKLDELLKIEQALDNRNQQLKNLIYKLSKKWIIELEVLYP